MAAATHYTFLPDPLGQFAEWFQLASSHEVNDPDAMSLATLDADGMPNVRILLNRGVDARGFRFMTNSESQKGKEMVANPHAALCFHWKSLRRQVRAQGSILKVSDVESDAYFMQRPRQSQIGAWASQQSRRLESMEALNARVWEVEKRYADRAVDRPPYWHGYILMPETIEFWIQGEYRLHERMLYTRDGDTWQMERLYP